MTFEEFFKKKRVDLLALEKAEPALFAEFKTHYEEMGEKSFDHTKKYWFNKTRRKFPLAPEIKTEKPHIPNPLAEQTVTESLEERGATISGPKIGFTPKFRAAGIAKPVVEDKKEELPNATEPAPAPPVENPSSKPAGFVPRFKMKPKTEDEEFTPPPLPTTSETQPTENTAAGFVPRFKMKPKSEGEETKPDTTAAKSVTTETTAPKPAYKPRFVPPKPKIETQEDTPGANDVQPAPPETTAAPKPAYKPRFIPPKPKE